MGMIKDIYDILTDLYDRYKSEGFDANKEAVFSNLIQRPYVLLQQVHTDYLEIFTELRRKVSNQNGIGQDTLNWLAKARIKEQVHRSELQDLELDGVLDQFSRKTYRRQPSDKLRTSIEDFGACLNEYFAGPMDVSHSLEMWDLLKVVTHLTQSAEELAKRFNNLAGDVFEALDSCQFYLEDKLYANEVEVVNRINNNIQLSRLLAECDIDPNSPITQEGDEKLKRECGYSFEELLHQDKEFLENLLYVIVSKKATSFSVHISDASHLPVKPSSMSLAEFAQSLVARFDQREKTEWANYNQMRKILEETLTKKQLWILFLQEFIDNKIKTLESKLSKVNKAYRQVEKEFGLLTKPKNKQQFA